MEKLIITIILILCLITCVNAINMEDFDNIDIGGKIISGKEIIGENNNIKNRASDGFNFNSESNIINIKFYDYNDGNRNELNKRDSPKIRIIDIGDNTYKFAFCFNLPSYNFIGELVLNSNKEIIPSVINNMGNTEYFFVGDRIFKYDDMLNDNFQVKENLKDKTLSLIISKDWEKYGYKEKGVVCYDPTISYPYQLSSTYYWQFEITEIITQTGSNPGPSDLPIRNIKDFTVEIPNEWSNNYNTAINITFYDTFDLLLDPSQDPTFEFRPNNFRLKEYRKISTGKYQVIFYPKDISYDYYNLKITANQGRIIEKNYNFTVKYDLEEKKNLAETIQETGENIIENIGETITKTKSWIKELWEKIKEEPKNILYIVLSLLIIIIVIGFILIVNKLKR